jgi:hypothetical protein
MQLKKIGFIVISLLIGKTSLSQTIPNSNFAEEQENKDTINLIHATKSVNIETDSSKLTKENSNIPKVFLICEFCDIDFYKNEIAHLLFVRDQRLADFTVLFRVINTGSGGNEYNLEC